MPARLLLPALAAACVLPFVPPAGALVAGIAFALALGNPWLGGTKRFVPLLLGLAVTGLGGTADLAAVAHAGTHGVLYTAAGIVFTCTAGFLLARTLTVPADTAALVTAGTAICGGSAIAAVAPAIRARTESVSVALASVFLLNATALVVFPPLGRLAGLGEPAFGLFAALAIHDTSSVVGAAASYGPRAVEVATTVKLARTLWIVPLAFVLGQAFARRDGTQGSVRAKLPWFLAGFVAVAALVTAVPALRGAGVFVATGARRLLVVTLFLIGSTLTRDAITKVGARPFLLAVVLWVLTATVTLGAILAGWIG